MLTKYKILSSADPNRIPFPAVQRWLDFGTYLGETVSPAT